MQQHHAASTHARTADLASAEGPRGADAGDCRQLRNQRESNDNDVTSNNLKQFVFIEEYSTLRD
jgi:hypothetical protein